MADAAKQVVAPFKITSLCGCEVINGGPLVGTRMRFAPNNYRRLRFDLPSFQWRKRRELAHNPFGWQ